MLDFATDAHSYQRNGAAHLWNSAAHNGVAALWLDPGYGKTMIVLHAFKALRDAGIVKTMLVVAPLRVAQTVWAQEIGEWASLNGLRACLLHGHKKEKWLDRRDVDIWIINYEGIPWFLKIAKAGRVGVVDVVVFDEVRRMKNAQGKRFKAARPLTEMAKFKWGLTGTPASNGLMDLFGQFLILDGGESLGKHITKYRLEFFEQGFDGFTYIPRPGSQEQIEKRIEHYIYRADGHLDLPELVEDLRRVPLTTEAMKTYKRLKRDLITELEESGQKITAANSAVLYGKLKQMSGGRVYDEDGNVLFVHDAKKEALLELVEELGDEQLLIAYHYNHELEQIKDALGDIPHIGSGVNEKTALDHVAKWNSGEVRLLAAHPASAGHGLNLQKGSAHHILWWGPTIDLDFFIQFTKRLLRQGNKASHVVAHAFVAEGTVDESDIVSRGEKDSLQSRLLRALTVEFGDAIVADEETQTEDQITMSDLQFKSDANQQQNPFAPQQTFGGNGEMGQHPTSQPAPQPTQNPFAPQAQQPAPQPAPAQNPFAPQPAQQSAPQTAPAPNPFAQPTPTPQPAPTQQFEQQAAIHQDVAAPPPPQPNPAAAPANPFQQPGQPPAEDAQVVPSQTPAVQDTGWQAPQPGPATEQPATNAPVVQTVAAPAEGVWVPVNLVVPADKLEKVYAAVARALK